MPLLPVKKPRKTPFVIGFDSEDDGKGTPFLWCFVSSEGSYHATSREQALVWLSMLAENKRKTHTIEVWATNLEYDMVNLFGQDHIIEVALKFGRSALVGASWRGINFRDTMRYIPISVEKWGEIVGLEKLERDLFASADSDQTGWNGNSGNVPNTQRYRRFLTRCKRDAAITYRAALFIHERFSELGERPRMTLASSALNLWRNQFWRQPLKRPDDEVWQAALSAYHGGRTQAFSVGSYLDVIAIDVASMFPWAMTKAEMPVPWGLYRLAKEGEHVLPWGLYKVRVTSDIPRPMLPVRTSQGTVYPNGEWEAWYVGEELISALDHGVKVHVLSGFVFSELCRPFDDYVAEIFRRKNRSRGGPKLFYKFMANTLYGKFRTARQACVGDPNASACHDAATAA